MGSCEHAKIPVEADLAVFQQNYYWHICSMQLLTVKYSSK